MTTQLHILEVEVKKTGSNARGPWTLYKVKAEGDKGIKWFSTFLALKPGDRGDFLIESEQGRDGKTYWSIKGWNNASKPVAPPQAPGLEAHIEVLYTDLRALEQRVTKLEAAQPTDDPSEPWSGRV